MAVPRDRATATEHVYLENAAIPVCNISLLSRSLFSYHCNTTRNQGQSGSTFTEAVKLVIPLLHTNIEESWLVVISVQKCQIFVAVATGHCTHSVIVCCQINPHYEYYLRGRATFYSCPTYVNFLRCYRNKDGKFTFKSAHSATQHVPNKWTEFEVENSRRKLLSFTHGRT